MSSRGRRSRRRDSKGTPKLPAGPGPLVESQSPRRPRSRQRSERLPDSTLPEAPRQLYNLSADAFLLRSQWLWGRPMKALWAGKHFMGCRNSGSMGCTLSTFLRIPRFTTRKPTCQLPGPQTTGWRGEGWDKGTAQSSGASCRGLWELLCGPSQALEDQVQVGLRGSTRLRCHFVQNKGRAEDANLGLLDASRRWD